MVRNENWKEKKYAEEEGMGKLVISMYIYLRFYNVVYFMSKK